MASSTQLFLENQKNIDSNSFSEETPEGPPIYSLLSDEQPIDSETKTTIPQYAAVDKSRLSYRNMSPPPPPPKSLNTDVTDGKVFQDSKKNNGFSNAVVPEASNNENEVDKENEVQAEDLPESCYSVPYVNVTSTATNENAHMPPAVAESSFNGRFSGILRKRGFSFTDGGKPPTKDRKTFDQKQKTKTFFVKNWTLIVISFVLIILSVCIFISLIEISRLKRNQPTLTVSEMEKLLQKYYVGHNDSNVATFEELLENYHERTLEYCNTTSAINNMAVKVINRILSEACQPVNSSWVRVIELDMSDPSSWCPTNFTLTNISSEFRTCTPVRTSPGCTSVFFSTRNLTYSKVIGKIKAYQYGNTNSFRPYRRGNRTIDEPYVDGVSLTYGQPRQHIWTFAADDANTINSFCPCSGKANIEIPEYIGEDYFCDTGEATNRTFAVDNPLWDGKGCVTNYTCCTFNNPPWFYKQLPIPTSEPIELRVCTDQFTSSESLALETVNIYAFN